MSTPKLSELAGDRPDYACLIPSYNFRGHTLREAIGKLSRWEGLDGIDDQVVPMLTFLAGFDEGAGGVAVYSITVDLPVQRLQLDDEYDTRIDFA